MFEFLILTLQRYLTEIVLVILIYNLIKYLWDRRYLYYYSIKTNGPVNLPIVGYGWKFLGNNRDIFKILENFCKIYKPPAAVWLGPDLYFVMSDPNHYEIIFNKTLHKLKIYDFISEAIGTGIFTAPVDKWKRQRKLIQPTFNQKILNTFVEVFAKQSKTLVDNNLNEQVEMGFIDIFPILNKFIMTLVCDTILGDKVLTKEQITNIDEWLNTSGKLVCKRMYKIWYHPKMLWNLTSSSKTLNKYCRAFESFLREIVVQKRSQYRLRQFDNAEFYKKDAKIKWKGFIDYMIEISEQNNGQLTDQDIIEEAALLLLAGTDTTAVTSSFFLIMLGLYPDIQDKIFNELQSIFGESDRSVEIEDLNKMLYLERALKETLRLYPAGPVIGRVLDEDIDLGSHILPKGSSCLLAIFETHRNPEIWKNPLKFEPDRFLPEEVAKRHPYSFIPFAAGPRNCIGIKYAMMAMKVVLSTTLRSYKISTSYKTLSDIKLEHAVVLTCNSGFNVSLKYRNGY